MMADSPTDVQQDTPELSPDAATEWRRARFEELGFNAEEAVGLSKAKQVEYTGAGTEKDPRKEWQQPLSWQKVDKALKNGCTREMALQIFLA
jgi:hypothetical protein